MDCAYKNCFHDDKSVDEADLVVVKSKYYHADCYRKSQQVNELVKLYSTRINSKVNYPILVSVIRNLIVDNNVDFEYLKFAINYYADNKIKIKTPLSLHYLKTNNYMKERWEKSKKKC